VYSTGEEYTGAAVVDTLEIEFPAGAEEYGTVEE